MNEIVKKLGLIGIVPVIALDRVEDAEPLANALIRGGLPCAEVTFRTAAAEESIRIMTEKFPELLVGAGTVLTPEQVDRAVNAGAKFIVSPGLNPNVVAQLRSPGSKTTSSGATFSRQSAEILSKCPLQCSPNTSIGFTSPPGRCRSEIAKTAKSARLRSRPITRPRRRHRRRSAPLHPRPARRC